MINAKFKSDVLVGYAALGGTMICAFSIMLSITQWGSVAVYGTYMLMASLLNVAGNFVSFRTNEALVFFFKQGESTHNPAQSKFAIVAGIGIDLAVGALLLLLLSTFAEAIAATILKDVALAHNVTIYGIIALVTSLRSTPYGLLQALERTKTLNLIRLSEQFLRLGFILTFVLRDGALSLHTIALSVLLAATASTTMATLPLIGLMSSRFSRARWLDGQVIFRPYLKFCLTTFASSALKAGNQNIDTLAVGLFTDPRTAGIYATFRQFLSPIAFLSGPFANVAYPQFVKACVAGRGHELRTSIQRIDRKLLGIGGLATLALVPLILGYSTFTGLDLTNAAIFAFLLLALRALLQTRLWWARPFSNATRPVLSLISNAGATGFLLLILFPMTAKFGLPGAALSMLALSILLTLFWHRVSRRMM